MAYVGSYLWQLRQAIGHELALIPGAMVALRREDGLVLFTRRGDDGTWCLPAGSAESGGSFARTFIDLGYYISFSGIVTFRSAEALRVCARQLPHDRVLIETDTPYLAPVPKRGKRNEPAFVAHTAAFIAGLKDVSVEALTAATTDNFHRLFPKARRAASNVRRSP